MHAYSTSTTERIQVPVMLFAISVALAGVVATLLDHYRIEVPWWISFPSIGGLYAVLFFLFDRFLWKHALVRSIFQVKIPVLHGEWKGFVTPASGENGSVRSATLVVDQHWSMINVCLATEGGDGSESRSTMAAVRDEHTSRPMIQYAYENKPRESAVGTMQQHPGTAELRFTRRDGQEVLSGGYYTGRGRGSTGVLEFSRASSDAASGHR